MVLSQERSPPFLKGGAFFVLFMISVYSEKSDLFTEIKIIIVPVSVIKMPPIRIALTPSLSNYPPMKLPAEHPNA